MKLTSVFALYLSCIFWFNTAKSQGVEDGLMQVLNPQLFNHFGDITKTVGTSGHTAYKVLRTIIVDRMAKNAAQSVPSVPAVPAVPVEAVPVVPVTPVQAVPVVPVQEAVPVQVVEAVPVQQLPAERVVACPPTTTLPPPCPPTITPPPCPTPVTPPPTTNPCPAAAVAEEVVIIESTAPSTVATPPCALQSSPVTEWPTTVRPTEGPIIVASPSVGPTTVTCPLEGPTTETLLLVGPTNVVVPVAPPATTLAVPATSKPCRKKKICRLLEKKAQKYDTGACAETDKKCLKKAKKLAKISKLLQKKCTC